jgi:amino acid transporter
VTNATIIVVVLIAVSTAFSVLCIGAIAEWVFRDRTPIPSEELEWIRQTAKKLANPDCPICRGEGVVGNNRSLQICMCRKSG